MNGEGNGNGTVAIALTIAGSDSGGGAGIQADLKTFQRFGVYGSSVITAVTAQNTFGVETWCPVGPRLVRAQIDAVADDLRPGAVKTGMLANAAVIDAVSSGIRAHALAPYVLDPVMVATSGDPLFDSDVVTAIRKDLLPLCTIVTPNLHETQMLLGATIKDIYAMRRAAEELVREHRAGAALVKGGHLPGDIAVDVLYVDGAAHAFEHPRIDTPHTHGTGCTLSAAITAQLAQGADMVDAVRLALDFVHYAIRTAPGIGGGHGPLNHIT